MLFSAVSTEIWQECHVLCSVILCFTLKITLYWTRSPLCPERGFLSKWNRKIWDNNVPNGKEVQLRIMEHANLRIHITMPVVLHFSLFIYSPQRFLISLFLIYLSNYLYFPLVSLHVSVLFIISLHPLWYINHIR